MQDTCKIHVSYMQDTCKNMNCHEVTLSFGNSFSWDLLVRRWFWYGNFSSSIGSLGMLLKIHYLHSKHYWFCRILFVLPHCLSILCRYTTCISKNKNIHEKYLIVSNIINDDKNEDINMDLKLYTRIMITIAIVNAEW